MDDYERCTCDHGSDNMCLNGVVYGYCLSEVCGGSCIDMDTCMGGPGCCDTRRNGRA